MKHVVHSVVAAVAVLLSAGAALATLTPQQRCDVARVAAWARYVSCVDGVVATVAHGDSFDEVAAFAKCRHNYFHNWATFQTAARYIGSTCVGPRFVDNGDGTVTDSLTTLVWEQKTNDSTVHDEGNFYTWSSGSNAIEDGTAFTSFLADVGTGLNTAGFAGANGWRLPTFVELQTILRDFACRGTGGGPTCTCGSMPCIDGIFGPTQSFYYWSATGNLPNPNLAWLVHFTDGTVFVDFKTGSYDVRAVRGGL